MKKVNLSEKLSLLNDFWKPKIIGELNQQVIKLAKLKGEFVWHQHKNEDEMFMVITGSLTIKLRDQTIELNEGEFFIIPSGVEHLPIAKEEVHILLFEPKTTIKTGD
ncbi:MAG: cupin domain-containing protein [Cocleimonas sp.]|nr:cupin domain-containing protein [Cocleimonas sp.]